MLGYPHILYFISCQIAKGLFWRNALWVNSYCSATEMGGVRKSDSESISIPKINNQFLLRNRLIFKFLTPIRVRIRIWLCAHLCHAFTHMLYTLYHKNWIRIRLEIRLRFFPKIQIRSESVLISVLQSVFRINCIVGEK